jgi:hypothetical protein
MKRALIYTLAGTLISFFINHFLLESGGLWLELFYGFAFGLAWGLAYYLRHCHLFLNFLLCLLAIICWQVSDKTSH